MTRIPVLGSLLLLSLATTTTAWTQTKIPESERSLGAEIPTVIARLGMEPDELPRAIRPFPVPAVTGAQKAAPGVEVIFDRKGSPWAVLAGGEHRGLPEKDSESLAWASSVRSLLGLGQYQVRFHERATTFDGVTRVFDLYYRGIRVHGSSLRLHWDLEGFAGATAHGPAELGQVDALDGDDPGKRMEYVPYSKPDGKVDLAIATVKVERDSKGRFVSTYTPRGHKPFTVVVRRPVATHPGPAAALRQLTPTAPQIGIAAVDPFQTWIPPSGTFPDQIDISPSGLIWYSAPSNDRIVSLDPVTDTFQFVPLGPGKMPDGLVIDDSGVVWFGCYSVAELGSYDPQTQTTRFIQPPVAASNMAVPSTLANGHIVVTDHSGWLLEYDPSTAAWVASDHTLSGTPHLVAASEDTVNQQIAMTQFTVRSLGMRPTAGGSIVDIPIPGSRSPAFLEAYGGKIYFSIWNSAELGIYDPVNGQFTFESFGLSSAENGGPMDVTADGDVIVGTRGNGFIAVYRTDEDRMSTHPIPSLNPNLKDGLRVEKNGVVWFTESGGNRITRLRYLQ